MLCERIMPQTLHHLVPRTTWKKLKKRLPETWALPADADAKTIDDFVHKTVSICRPCHSMIHSTHDELTLALHYFTLARLLDDPTIRKFCAWATKQKDVYSTNARMQFKR
ncbi:hypothetical protein JKP88DRAFT_297311 [Tribonema minus]|uniref:Uncharacterized protein n=1 Tax=Tribonema minus TaxID=303371 RepID=A0A836CLM6_9STRA|nr:hypothetical protein JKP88DRAFT_297311 [Tribonema minus]